MVDRKGDPREKGKVRIVCWYCIAVVFLTHRVGPSSAGPMHVRFFNQAKNVHRCEPIDRPGQLLWYIPMVIAEVFFTLYALLKAVVFFVLGLLAFIAFLLYQLYLYLVQEDWKKSLKVWKVMVGFFQSAWEGLRLLGEAKCP